MAEENCIDLRNVVELKIVIIYIFIKMHKGKITNARVNQLKSKL
jgi:hypothetical protein